MYKLPHRVAKLVELRIKNNSYESIFHGCEECNVKRLELPKRRLLIKANYKAPATLKSFVKLEELIMPSSCSKVDVNAALVECPTLRYIYGVNDFVGFPRFKDGAIDARKWREEKETQKRKQAIKPNRLFSCEPNCYHTIYSLRSLISQLEGYLYFLLFHGNNALPLYSKHDN